MEIEKISKKDKGGEVTLKKEDRRLMILDAVESSVKAALRMIAGEDIFGVSEAEQANDGTLRSELINLFNQWENIVSKLGSGVDELVLRTVVDITVALFDVYLVDLMTSEDKDKAITFTYYRSDHTKWQHFFLLGKPTNGNGGGILHEDLIFYSKSEFERYLRHMETTPYTVDSVSGFLKKIVTDNERRDDFVLPIVPINETHELRDIPSLRDSFMGSGHQQAFYVPIRIGDKLGAYYVIGSKKGFSSMIDSPVSKSVPSTIPLQDVWRGVLLAGIPVFGDNSAFMATNEKPSNSINDDMKAKRMLFDFLNDWYKNDNLLDGVEGMLARKLILACKKYLSGEGDEYLRELIVSHKQFLMDEFGHEKNHGRCVTLRLTRSGVSANSLAIEVAKKIIGGDELDVYNYGGLGGKKKEYNLFYDSEGVMTGIVSASLKKANCFLINALPNGSVVSYEEYLSFRDELITNVFSLAETKPEEKFVIVCDKSMDLGYFIDFNGHDLPSNLTIIYTASLSKWQRGLRHGFYGAMWVFGKNDVVIDEDMLNYSLVGLTDYGIVTFPHPTKAKAERVKQHFMKISERLRDHRLNNGNLKMVVYPGFVTFSGSTLEVDVDKIKVKLKLLEETYGSDVIQIGDSYGFPHIRVGVWFGYLRISFGDRVSAEMHEKIINDVTGLLLNKE